jgi:integrase
MLSQQVFLLKGASSMPRQPKPFFHRGWWITDIGGQRTKLARGEENRKIAEQALYELLSKRGNESDGKTVQQLAVWELCEQFLEWIQLHRSKSTFADYHHWLSRWVKLHGKKRARDVRALDLESWKATLAKSGLKPCTVNHAIVAAQTAWNWAVKNELLPSSPLRHVEKLFADGRQRVITPDEFRSLLRHCFDAVFRQVLLAIRLTGARPGELRKLTWEMVDFDNHIWVIRKHKTSRTAKEGRPRIVPMPPIVERLLRWRLRKYGHQSRFVFLNSAGKPWTKDALVQRMESVRRRAGIVPNEDGETLVLYSARHSYATTAIASKVTDRRLADLLGHTTTRTTQRYIHLAHSDLHKAALEATSSIFRRKTGS